MPAQSHRYIPMSEAARMLHVSKARISQLLGTGALSGELVEGRRMVDVASLERYRTEKETVAEERRVQSFTLMSADYEIARVTYSRRREHALSVCKILDPARMPFGTVTSNDTVRARQFADWWEHRSIPSTRPGLVTKLNELGTRDAIDLLPRSLGLSLSDCYWLRPDDQPNLSWGAINYFENDFEGATSDNWDEWLGAVGLDSPDNTSEGELPKRWGIRNGTRVLIKGCTTDDQRPFNEVVGTALHRRLLDSGEFVSYELTQVQGEPACICADFLQPAEEYVPAVYVKNNMGAMRGSSFYDRFARYAGRWTGDEESVRQTLSQMIVCDALIANIDRHWRNFGFVRNVDTLQMRAAPLFDSGNSLWYQKRRAELERGDWTFPSRPFDINPERQLASADRLDWFDPAMLDGFVDEAVEILSQSESATHDGKLDLIATGLAERARNVATVIATLRHVQR